MSMDSNTDQQRLPYKQENSFEKRAGLSAKIRRAHPDRVPVIVERHAKNTTVPDIQKRKFLAPGDITVAQFVSEIRKHIQLKPEEAIWLFVNGSALPHSAAVMSQIYEQHKDEDGFLYIVYSGQDLFGSC
eukprot:TRINITY_DN117_c0_g1_i1.p2 TRINITY_DN117_c0_g1~~TRINITY_DN117_c0_g1_i1.p2  ORF type:complete len:130 (-),score=17.04 TRINITY_DN117_c0_g1_i1:651-1040(-)